MQNRCRVTDAIGFKMLHQGENPACKAFRHGPCCGRATTLPAPGAEAVPRSTIGRSTRQNHLALSSPDEHAARQAPQAHRADDDRRDVTFRCVRHFTECRRCDPLANSSRTFTAESAGAACSSTRAAFRRAAHRARPSAVLVHEVRRLGRRRYDWLDDSASATRSEARDVEFFTLVEAWAFAISFAAIIDLWVIAVHRLTRGATSPPAG